MGAALWFDHARGRGRVIPWFSKACSRGIAIPIAPQTFAGAIRTTPILMLMGRTDGFYSAADAQQLHDLIPSPQKSLVFFDSGHRLPPEYGPRAVEWLKTHLAVPVR